VAATLSCTKNAAEKWNTAASNTAARGDSTCVDATAAMELAVSLIFLTVWFAV
jgi:hypothetical protein